MITIIIIIVVVLTFFIIMLLMIYHFQPVMVVHYCIYKYWLRMGGRISRLLIVASIGPLWPEGREVH